MTLLHRYNNRMDIKHGEFCAEVSNILNLETPKRSDFYIEALKKLSKYVKCSLCGVYFLDALSLSKKALLKDGKPFLEDEDIFKQDFPKRLMSQKEAVVLFSSKDVFLKQGKENFVAVAKLHIKSSFFGFFFFAGDGKNYSKETLLSLEALVSVYSYLIKDHELSQVFKFQLNALQEAVLEKDEACRMVEKQHKKLLELDKVKNNFLANISHELRTPLNAILGFSQALDAKIFGELNPKQAEYVKDIYTSGLYLLNMINELLDLAKIESGTMKINLAPISPKVIVEEVLNVLSPLALKKNISLNFETVADGEVVADHLKFRQILYNLLSNAIKFTPENGKVTVRTSFCKKRFILEVCDSGAGIDPKDHKKIFLKFVQLESEHGKSEPSTGLGLPITKELVKLHGGKISLSSAPLKGSVFKVELPRGGEK